MCTFLLRDEKGWICLGGVGEEIATGNIMWEKNLLPIKRTKED